MDKSIQNSVWATLPKDFKKEVRKEYKIACDIYEADPYNIRAEANYKLMEKVFGGDNLTSEEKPQPKFKVGDKVKILSDIYKDKSYHVSDVHFIYPQFNYNSSLKNYS